MLEKGGCSCSYEETRALEGEPTNKRYTEKRGNEKDFGNVDLWPESKKKK